MSEIAIELDKDTYTPGEAVSGAVRVVEGGGSRALTVELHFCEQANQYDAVARKVEAPAPVHTGDLQAGATLPFTLALPPDAPPTFVSAHGRLFWAVEARSDERGRDAKTRREIAVVLP